MLTYIYIDIHILCSSLYILTYAYVIILAFAHRMYIRFIAFESTYISDLRVNVLGTIQSTRCYNSTKENPNISGYTFAISGRKLRYYLFSNI
jgi:hypothetical protein